MTNDLLPDRWRPAVPLAQ